LASCYGGAVCEEDAMSGTATWMGRGCGASSRSSHLSWVLDFISVCLLMGS